MRTKTEIEQMIELLRDEKKNIVEFSIFGNNNHKAIDYQISCLEGEYDEDDIYDICEEQEDDIEAFEVVNIFQWLNGSIEGDEIIDDFNIKLSELNSNSTVCKVPCNECPFKKNSLRGYLGPHTIADIKEIARGGVDFKCHKTLDSDDASKFKTCAGYIHYLNNTAQVSRNPIIANRQKEMKNKDNGCLGFDFDKHHTIEKIETFQEFKNKK